MDWSPSTSSSAAISHPYNPSSMISGTSSSHTPSPFMFHSSSLKSSSTSRDETMRDPDSKSENPAPPRDIAQGAIVRERKKRDKLKDWQVALPASSKSVSVTEGDDDDDDDGDHRTEMENYSEDEEDGREGNIQTDSPGFSESLKSLMVSMYLQTVRHNVASGFADMPSVLATDAISQKRRTSCPSILTSPQLSLRQFCASSRRTLRLRARRQHFKCLTGSCLILCTIESFHIASRAIYYCFSMAFGRTLHPPRLSTVHLQRLTCTTVPLPLIDFPAHAPKRYLRTSHGIQSRVLSRDNALFGVLPFQSLRSKRTCAGDGKNLQRMGILHE